MEQGGNGSADRQRETADLEDQLLEGVEQAWQQNGAESLTTATGQANANTPPQPALAPIAGATLPVQGADGGQQIANNFVQMFQQWLSQQQQQPQPRSLPVQPQPSTGQQPFAIPALQQQQQQQPQLSTQFQAPVGNAQDTIPNALSTAVQQGMVAQQQQLSIAAPNVQQLIQAFTQTQATSNNTNTAGASQSPMPAPGMPAWGQPQNPLPGLMAPPANNNLHTQLNHLWAQQQMHQLASHTSVPQIQAMLVQLLQQLLAGGMYGQQQNSAVPPGVSTIPDIFSVLPAFLQLLCSIHQAQSSSVPFAPQVLPTPPFAQPFVPFAQGVAAASQSAGVAQNFASANIGAPAKASAGQTCVPKKKRKYSHEAFPQKLHRLITEAAENEEERVAVHWTEDGTRFKIVDTSGFEKILPRYFRHGNIASFKRLLHMYDFKRIMGKIFAAVSSSSEKSILLQLSLTGTWNEGMFEHPKFKRDDPDLCKEIARVDRCYGSLY